MTSPSELIRLCAVRSLQSQSSCADRTGPLGSSSQQALHHPDTPSAPASTARSPPALAVCSARARRRPSTRQLATAPTRCCAWTACIGLRRHRESSSSHSRSRSCRKRKSNLRQSRRVNSRYPSRSWSPMTKVSSPWPFSTVPQLQTTLDSITSSNHRFVTTRSPDFVEVAVATEAVLEAARARHTVRDQRFAPVVPFLNQRLAHAEPMALDRGASIGAHANLWEACDLPRQLLRLRAGASLGSDVFAQADIQALLRRHLAPRQNDLQRATLADDSRQPHGSPVDQRHTPTAAIDAEVRALRHHPEIAPQPHFHPAGDGRALDGRDDRLVQLEPGGPERSARNFPAIAARPCRGDIELAQRIVGIERAHVFEIPARAKRAARAIENRDAGIPIGIEFEKGGGQRIRAFGVHGVAGFGPVVNHGPYRSILLNSDCHLGYPPHDEPLDKRLAGDDSKAVTGSSAPQSMGGRIA